MQRAPGRGSLFRLHCKMVVQQGNIPMPTVFIWRLSRQWEQLRNGTCLPTEMQEITEARVGIFF